MLLLQWYIDDGTKRRWIIREPPQSSRPCVVEKEYDEGDGLWIDVGEVSVTESHRRVTIPEPRWG